jgi:hypothetical protein
MTMEHFRIDKIICPWCTSIHDCASGIEANERPPEDGDTNICIRCECISIYDSTVPGGLRLPTDVELVEAMDDEEVQKTLWALNQTHYLIKKGTN